MANYQHRLDRVEKIVAPRRACPHMVWLNARQTKDEGVAAYAQAQGPTVPEVEADMICFSWADRSL